MPRQAKHSDSLLADVRRHFGLTQFELAVYLGVSAELVKHIEAGRRGLSSAVLLRLNPLALLLPATPEPAPAGLPTGLPAPAADPLEARRDFCVFKAAKLRYELRGLTQQAAYTARWQQALPQLLAALPAAATPDEQARTERRRGWLQRRVEAFSPHDVAQHHLLRLQAEALETEAEAITALLER